VPVAAAIRAGVGPLRSPALLLISRCTPCQSRAHRGRRDRLPMCHVVPPEHADSFALEPHHSDIAASFATLEPGDTFCAGQGFVHWFTADALRAELNASMFALEEFRVSAIEDSGSVIGAARLRCLHGLPAASDGEHAAIEGENGHLALPAQ